MSVTAFLVTRNHEESLERALRSVAGLSTESIVIDTGSTDRTVAIAKGLGAHVHPVAWADDFAAACNTGVEQATSDWVLWLNPDEEVGPGGLPILAEMMNNKSAFAFALRVQQELRSDRHGHGTANWQVRLFRRDPAVRFRGRLHPTFLTPPAEVAAARGLVMGTCTAVIHRHAYLSRPTPDKMRWVVRLLEAELGDRPGQLQYQIELGRNLLWLNDPRGHEVLADAAQRVWQAADAPAPPTSAVGLLLEYLLAVTPQQSRSNISRDQARELASRWFRNSPPIIWALAQERFAEKDYQAAAPLLERLLEMGRTGAFEFAESFDPDILGHLALMNLGLCRLHLGAWDKALECFGPLLADPVHREQATRGYGYAEQQRQQASNERGDAR